MTVIIKCDKCQNPINEANENAPGHAITIDTIQYHTCTPCFIEHGYENMLTGGIDLTTGQEPKRD